MRKTLLIATLLMAAAPAFGAPSQADKLFSDLKQADSPEIAKPIEDKINALFRQSGSASVDLLMTRVGVALAAADNQTAQHLLVSITVIAPDFAEGWHMRANAEAAQGKDAAALVSLQKAVLLNPRDFSALNELAGALEDYGDKPGALKLYRRALALDPQLPGAARRLKALTKEVEGQDI